MRKVCENYLIHRGYLLGGQLLLTGGAMKSIRAHREILAATKKTVALHNQQDKAIGYAIRLFDALLEGQTIFGKR